MSELTLLTAETRSAMHRNRQCFFCLVNLLTDEAVGFDLQLQATIAAISAIRQFKISPSLFTDQTIETVIQAAILLDTPHGRALHSEMLRSQKDRLIKLLSWTDLLDELEKLKRHHHLRTMPILSSGKKRIRVSRVRFRLN